MHPSYVTREKSANWLKCDFFQKLVHCCQWYHSSSVMQHSVFSYRWLWHLPQQKYTQNALLCFHSNMVKGTRPSVMLNINCQSFCRMLKDYRCCSMKFLFTYQFVCDEYLDVKLRTEMFIKTDTDLVWGIAWSIKTITNMATMWAEVGC
jgi:hypothetical protein